MTDSIFAKVFDFKVIVAIAIVVLTLVSGGLLWLNNQTNQIQLNNPKQTNSSSSSSQVVVNRSNNYSDKANSSGSFSPTFKLGNTTSSISTSSSVAVSTNSKPKNSSIISQKIESKSSLITSQSSSKTTTKSEIKSENNPTIEPQFKLKNSNDLNSLTTKNEPICDNNRQVKTFYPKFIQAQDANKLKITIRNKVDIESEANKQGYPKIVFQNLKKYLDTGVVDRDINGSTPAFDQFQSMFEIGCGGFGSQIKKYTKVFVPNVSQARGFVGFVGRREQTEPVLTIYGRKGDDYFAINDSTILTKSSVETISKDCGNNESNNFNLDVNCLDSKILNVLDEANLNSKILNLINIFGVE